MTNNTKQVFFYSFTFNDKIVCVLNPNLSMWVDWDGMTGLHDLLTQHLADIRQGNVKVTSQHHTDLIMSMMKVDMIFRLRPIAAEVTREECTDLALAYGKHFFGEHIIEYIGED